VTVDEEHVDEKAKMAAKLDSVSNKKTNGSACEVRSLGLLDDERSSEVTPAVRSANMVLA
jgi:hypothetical protein